MEFDDAESLSQALREAQLYKVTVLPARLQNLMQEATDYSESVADLPSDKEICKDFKSTTDGYRSRFKDAKSVAKHEKGFKTHPELQQALDAKFDETEKAIDLFKGMWEKHCEKKTPRALRPAKKIKATPAPTPTPTPAKEKPSKEKPAKVGEMEEESDTSEIESEPNQSSNSTDQNLYGMQPERGFDYGDFVLDEAKLHRIDRRDDHVDLSEMNAKEMIAIAWPELFECEASVEPTERHFTEQHLNFYLPDIPLGDLSWAHPQPEINIPGVVGGYRD